MQSTHPEHGTLTAQQWTMLVFAFLLGVASVFTIDRVFLSNTPPANVAHAATTSP